MSTPSNVPASRILRDIPETAAQLRLSEKTVRTMISRGEIEIIRLGWKIFVSQQAIDDFIESNRQRLGGGEAA